MEKIKRIGVLTSGGDAPGMNAAVRSVVRTAVYNGLQVMGIRKGYNGLLNGDIFEMNARSVSETLQRGGTILQTARFPMIPLWARLAWARRRAMSSNTRVPRAAR